MNPEELIRQLNLKAHPVEGGFFRETYRSEDCIAAGTIADLDEERNCSTAIYYLLTPDTFSELHRLTSDEVFHFYGGDAVEMLHLSPNGTSQVFRLGAHILDGELCQLVVPKNTWQGCRLVDGGRYALLGCTVSPGFDFKDYESGSRSELLMKYPEQKDRILKLTHKRGADV